MRTRHDAWYYIKAIQEHDTVVLSQAITLAESSLVSDQNLIEQILEALLPVTGKSLRIGISGIPGAGKSTFIEGLGQQIVKAGSRLAVLTVDPSSSLSQGSILGDKTRMEGLAAHPLAYIRTSPSQLHLGGTTKHTWQSMALCEAAGYKIVMVETVGTGQSEIELRYLIDLFILLLISGAGDALQAMKKGVLEVADMIFVNKADGHNKDEAEATCQQIANELSHMPSSTRNKTQVQAISALDQSQLKEIWQSLKLKHEGWEKNGTIAALRKHQNISLVHEMVKKQIVDDFYHHPLMKNVIKEKEKEAGESFISAMHAAKELLKIFKNIS